jgi:hypothetical protein
VIINFGKSALKLLALNGITLSLLLSPPALAQDSLAGIYQGFLAFDHKGEEVREWMMI